jgi:toxin-antitoxin system PIN domain toxin
MKAALLDVNVLIALLDPAHEFHEAAHAWFERNREFGWATCPITENGCLRILGKPAYPYLGLTVDKIRNILAEFCASGNHLFWPDSISVLDDAYFDLAGAGPKSLTDLYLLALTTVHSGRLITFDRGIHWKCVVAAGSDAVEVIT